MRSIISLRILYWVERERDIEKRKTTHFIFKSIRILIFRTKDKEILIYLMRESKRKWRGTFVCCNSKKILLRSKNINLEHYLSECNIWLSIHIWTYLSFMFITLFIFKTKSWVEVTCLFKFSNEIEWIIKLELIKWY